MCDFERHRFGNRLSFHTTVAGNRCERFARHEPRRCVRRPALCNRSPDRWCRSRSRVEAISSVCGEVNKNKLRADLDTERARGIISRLTQKPTWVCAAFKCSAMHQYTNHRTHYSRVFSMRGPTWNKPNPFVGFHSDTYIHMLIKSAQT